MLEHVFPDEKDYGVSILVLINGGWIEKLWAVKEKFVMFVSFVCLARRIK